MYTLSMLFNFHKEGEIAKKTIENLYHILQENNINNNTWKEIEVIAVLDNSDIETKEIILEHKELFHIIEEVSFGDAAHARNHAIHIANNNFILFADGDDYSSHDVLPKIYTTFSNHYNKLINSKMMLSQIDITDHIAVFPEYLITFPSIFQMKYFESNDILVQNSRFTHCFHSKIAIYKELLITYSVHENTPPYGYEDWDINNRLLHSGIHFKLAGYELYYRRADRVSNFNNHINAKSIVRNSSLYSYDFSQKKLQQNIEEIIEKPLQKSSKIRKFFAKSKILKQVYYFIKKYNKKESISLEKPEKNSIREPYKLFLESYNEEVFYREDLEFSSTEYFASQLSTQSVIYNQLLNFLREKEIVYFLPWVALGGADKVAIEYIKAVPNKKTCAITTINSGARIGKIGISHLDLCSQLHGWDDITEDEQLHILVKAIINSNIKLIHVVNSDIALRSIKFYSKVYQEYGVKTMVSLFCPDYDWVNDDYHGYPIMYPELFESADIILSDNNYWYDFFKKLNKGNDFTYKKLAVPVEEMPIAYHAKENTNKILWASRICNQKLFGVLEEIINTLPMYTFILYGGAPEEAQNLEIFERVKLKNNVEIRGEYQHISEIDFNEFDLFLFTSMFEGLPNMILETIMTAIPIVSAEVGGISEALGKDYPLLVKKHRSADAYIEKINLFYEDKEKIISDMLSIRNNIMKTHNEKIFQKEYLKVIDGLI